MDFLFSGFQWFRRLKGGTWYYTHALWFLQGGFYSWQNYELTCTHTVLKVENW